MADLVYDKMSKTKEVYINMPNTQESYDIIHNKIHAFKESSHYLKDKSDDFVFSALSVKATYYKNPALILDDTALENIVVDGQYDGGVDVLLTDPNSDTSDLVIAQSKYYTTITFDDIFNSIAKMTSFYKDMKSGHYENVNQKVEKRFLDLDAEVGEESKIHFMFFTSAPQKGIKRNSLEKKFRNLFTDSTNMDLTVQFGDDIVESIKELESRRPTVETGKIRIDEADNYLYYGDEAAIVNISAFSLKTLYAQYNTNLLARNLRYHIAGRTIDQGIEKTIQDSPDTFWFKNNGITIICDEFDIDGKEVKLTNFSIVNGGQTTYMIHKSKNVSAENDFYLPCKIIKVTGNTEDEKNIFSLEIAKATNSQKAIKAIDLKANSPEQVRFSQAMREVGIFYQTKRGEKVPSDYKLAYLNTDLSEVGKLCLSAIFQMPGTSRNKPSTLYNSPYYDTIFDKDQRRIASLSKELLYIDYYFKTTFLKQYDSSVSNQPNSGDCIAFAHNARTICLAFVMLASRVYYGTFTLEDVQTIFNCAKGDSQKSMLIDICKDLTGVETVLPKGLLNNKTNYESILSKLFNTILQVGQFTFSQALKYEEGLNATNYLKKDANYYSILESGWLMISPSIKTIFKEAEDMCK